MTRELVIEWVAPTLAAALVALLARSPDAGERFVRAAWRLRWPVLAATRILWPVIVWWVLETRLKHRTDLGWRAWRSERFLEGAIPGVDYPVFHGPLTPYLEGVGRWLVPGHPPVASLLFFLLGDVALVLLGARLARRFGERAEAWAGTWLLLSPLLWHQTAIRGQDEALFAAALAGGLWWASRGRDVAAGVVLALGFCATKPTFLPYAAVLFLALGLSRWRAAAAFVLVSATVYGLQAMVGASPGAAESLARHTDNFGAGIGIPDTLHRVFPSFGRGPALAGYVVLTGAVVVLAPRLLCSLPPEDRAWRSVLAVHAASMLSMPFCVSPYFAQGIAPALLLVAALSGVRARAFSWALAALGWLVAMHWTKAAPFTVPVKPAMIAFHAALLWLALRPSPGSGEAPAPGPAPAPGSVR